MAAASHENSNPNMDNHEGEGDTFDDIFDSYREKRVAEMKKAYAPGRSPPASGMPHPRDRAKQQEEMKGKSHGVYTILENEKELINAMKGSKQVVCHFGLSTFRRCTILDGHLRVRLRRSRSGSSLTDDV